MPEPCECTHGPYGHNQDDDLDESEPVTLRFPGFPPIKGVGPAITAIDATNPKDCLCTGYRPESSVRWDER